MRFTHHNIYGIDSATSDGWSVRVSSHRDVYSKWTYTTRSVIAPSRRWTCMSAAAGSSKPLNLSSAMLLWTVGDADGEDSGYANICVGAL